MLVYNQMKSQSVPAEVAPKPQRQKKVKVLVVSHRVASLLGAVKEHQKTSSSGGYPKRGWCKRKHAWNPRISLVLLNVFLILALLKALWGWFFFLGNAIPSFQASHRNPWNSSRPPVVLNLLWCRVPTDDWERSTWRRSVWAKLLLAKGNVPWKRFLRAKTLWDDSISEGFRMFGMV